MANSSLSTPEATPRPLVRARGISKTFGEGDTQVPVLKGVDLDVAMGEVLFLVERQDNPPLRHCWNS